MRSPIVFLHGWGRSQNDFEGLQALLKAKGWSTLAFDLPGFGQTLPPPEAWSVQDYAAYARAELEERAVRDVVIVGHSFGARVAAVLAAEVPALVRGLVLIGAPLVRSLTFKRRIFILLVKLWRLARSLPGAARLRHALEVWLRKRHYSMDILSTAEGVMRETLKRVIVQDLRPYLVKIKTPTLLMYGSRDMVTPPHIGQRALAYMPHAELVTIPEAGHMVILEKPEAVATEIRDFLNAKFKMQNSK